MFRLKLNDYFGSFLTTFEVGNIFGNSRFNRKYLSMIESKSKPNYHAKLSSYKMVRKSV